MKDFVRIGVATPGLKVADCMYNASEIIKLIKGAFEKKIKVLVFPELSITGYTCADLFSQDALIQSAEKGLQDIADASKGLDMFIAVGLPVRLDNQLFNTAVCMHKGKILGVIPKTYLPNHSEFYEERWFAPASHLKSNCFILCGQNVPIGTDIIFCNQNQTDFTIGVEICEDLWGALPPSSYHALMGAEVLLNLSASNELVYKDDYRRNLISQQSARTIGAYAYANAGFGESTTDLVFSGHSLICENGALLCESEKFKPESQITYGDGDIPRLKNERRNNNAFMEPAMGEMRQYRKITFYMDTTLEQVERYQNPHPFIPHESERNKRCENIFNIQVSGLSKRLSHTGVNTAVIGISGGLDSTLALLCTVKSFDYLGKDRKNILGITMPGFGTTDRTYGNAISLMKSLKITTREISIVEAALLHFKDIGHDPSIRDTTYENVQARERTQILMDIANQENGIVIGTGDMSELALGWATYNGDHMSMYAVNSGIPKTLVKALVSYVAETVMEKETCEILKDILDTPVSPELLPPDDKGKIEQKTEELVGPYELHDFFLYHVIRFGFSPKKMLFIAKIAFHGKYESDIIKKWLAVFYKRFFSQQFKRSCMPDGPKVGSVGLSPRGDLRMPSDASPAVWMKEFEDM